jgi:hypothetical protein
MSTTISSITRQGAFEPFELQVARGQIQGHQAVTVFGYNPDVDQTYETVWPDGGVVAHPAVATVMKVSSSSANDAAAGTGARSIYIEGLDANYNTVTETVTLNGQTEVNTTNSYLRINNFYTASVGSGGSNAGYIYIGDGTVTAGVPATIYDLMEIGFNSRTTGHYTVPAGYSAYFYQGRLTVAQATGANVVTGQLVSTTTDGITRVAAVTTLDSGVSEYDFNIPIPFPEKTDIEARAVGSANNNSVSCMLVFMLIKNGP